MTKNEGCRGENKCQNIDIRESIYRDKTELKKINQAPLVILYAWGWGGMRRWFEVE